MNRGSAGRTAALLAVAGLAVVGGSIGAGVAAGAPVNAGKGLPDGRAWEMVSPLDKNGGDIRGINGDNGGGVVQAAADGNRTTYVSLASFGDPQGAPVGSQYVSDRGAAGWRVRNITTPTSAQTYPLAGAGIPFQAFSSDVSSGLMLNGGGGTHFGQHPVENPPLAPGAPAGYQNFYLDSIPDGGLRALLTNTPPQGPETFNLELLGATSDLSHLVVKSSAALAPGAVEEAGEPNLYEWAGGQFQSLNVRPDGTHDLESSLALGSLGNGGRSRTISDDGSRVAWAGSLSPPLNDNALYVRDGIGTPSVRTVQVDASQGGPDPGGEGTFLTASSDLSKIFFADSARRLTPTATAGGGGQLGELYEFDIETGSHGELKDLTEGKGGAGVLGVLGASEDGSYVYFVANGVLASGVSPGTCKAGETFPGQTCNLYLWHEGTTKFIATLAGEDNQIGGLSELGVAIDWTPGIDGRTARVTPDGTHLLFLSRRSLTGYDNTVSSGTSCGHPALGGDFPAECEEVYLYDANTNHLSCASCNPSGARPDGQSGIPGGTDFGQNAAIYQSRALSADGSRVFFDSADALVAQDTNRQEDVYEYENGHVYLLSGGTGAGRSSFVDASADGNDVFFKTRAPLVAQDTDQLVDLYDARAPHLPEEAVGFPPLLAPAPCGGEDCRAAGPSAPAYVPLSSVTFAGMGNAVPAASTPAARPKPKKTKAKKGRKKKARRGRRARTGKSNVAAKGGSDRG